MLNTRNLGQTEDLPQELQEVLEEYRNGYKDYPSLPIIVDNKWGFEPGLYRRDDNGDWILDD